MEDLDEEGRLDVSGGRAVATGDTLPRRLSDTMQQRLDQLSNAASQVVQVAAVLPDRFSAGLLAAMLDRRPAALVSAVEEAVRADLLIEDGDQMRFRHDLLREADAAIVAPVAAPSDGAAIGDSHAGHGGGPEEVATQLARSAEPATGRDRRTPPSRTVGGLQRSERCVGFEQARVGAPAPRRPRTWATRDGNDRLLNRATRYEEAQRVGRHHPVSPSGAPEEEAEIRLRLPTVTTDTTTRHIEENRRALQLPDLSEVTRARHRAWLAYNL